MRLFVFLIFAISGCFAKEVNFKDNFKITSHKINLKEKEFSYTAIAGTLPIKNDNKEEAANIFFVSYTLDSAVLEDRPITFIFNGGPGSSSVWLHFGAFGPKKIELDEKLNNATLSSQLIENDESLLEYTDLVFIDPVGTGFSEVLPGKTPDNFYSWEGDVKAVGDFIYQYLATFDRWLSKKFIVGESYGTIRCVGVTEYLQDNFGVYLNGIALISPVLNASRMFDNDDHISYALSLPSFAATAWYHGVLPDYLQKKPLEELLSDVKSFALNEYTLSLIQGDLLPNKDRESIIDLLAQYSGIDKDTINRKNMRLDLSTFISSILPKDINTDLSYIVGCHDTRCTGYCRKEAYFGENPSLTNVAGSYSMIANDYIRRELNYINNEPYVIFNLEANRNWKWEKDFLKDFNNMDITQNLRHILMVNPELKVFVASGYYDLATPFAAVEYDLNHLHLPLKLKEQINFQMYEAGHMIYFNKKIHKKLTEDLLCIYK